MNVQATMADAAGMVVKNAKVSQMAFSKTVNLLDKARMAADNSARSTVQTAIDNRARAATARIGSNIDVYV